MEVKVYVLCVCQTSDVIRNVCFLFGSSKSLETTFRYPNVTLLISKFLKRIRNVNHVCERRVTRMLHTLTTFRLHTSVPTLYNDIVEPVRLDSNIGMSTGSKVWGPEFESSRNWKYWKWIFTKNKENKNKFENFFFLVRWVYGRVSIHTTSTLTRPTHDLKKASWNHFYN